MQLKDGLDVSPTFRLVVLVGGEMSVPRLWAASRMVSRNVDSLGRVDSIGETVGRKGAELWRRKGDRLGIFNCQALP